MPEERVPIITLTTDFGTRDSYVGAVKGVIIAINPHAKIVDITHEIPRGDLLEAAFTLQTSFETFPPRTIHLVVVDPGVGTSRRGILVSTDNYYFIAPDNGVLSFIYEREFVNRVMSLEADHYWRLPVSPTFHGRDIFAPTAAWMTKGVDPGNVGPEITDFKRIEVPKPKLVGDKQVEGLVLHVDRFGNLISNIHEQHLEPIFEKLGAEATYNVQVGDTTVKAVQKTYEGGAEGPIALIGSSGYVEVAIPKQDAEKTLGAKRGAPLSVQF
jgi:S-adenosylmethionine hydrolase